MLIRITVLAMMCKYVKKLLEKQEIILKYPGKFSWRNLDMPVKCQGRNEQQLKGTP